jgi:hypothetical protein
MYSLREEPRREFARSVWQRLSPRHEEEAAAPRPRFAFFPSLAVVGAALAVISLFVFPSVRASAQAFLSLFRVQSFAPIKFDPARLEKFSDVRKDLSLALFEREETNPPVREDVTSREAAENIAGIPVLEPNYLPDGLTRDKFQTVRHEDFRMRVNVDQLRTLIDALDLRDVDTPEELQGQWIQVDLNPVVFQSFVRDKKRVEMVQAKSPELTLPPGVDIQRLGEMGLRILGLDADEARRIAGSIDWNSTMVVPVPVNATEFRDVTIRGNKGLLVTTSRENEQGKERREGSIVLWTESGRIIGVNGNIESQDLLAIAESLR